MTIKTSEITVFHPAKEDLFNVFRLREIAWRAFQTSKDFPLKWYDQLDKSAVHWIIRLDNQIVAAARLNIITFSKKEDYLRINQILQKLNSMGESPDFPIGYFSRGVVHPRYNGRGFFKKLINSKMEFCKQNNIKTTLATTGREMVKESLLRTGWQIHGITNMEFDKDRFAYIMMKYL